MIIAVFYLFLAIGIITATGLILQTLNESYKKRYNQFYKTIHRCAIWTVIGCFVIVLRLIGAAVFRKLLEKSIRNFTDGTKSSTFIIYFTCATVFSDFVAYIAIMVCIYRRYKIWLDRLNLFPLGLPDNAFVPEQNILA